MCFTVQSSNTNKSVGRGPESGTLVDELFRGSLENPIGIVVRYPVLWRFDFHDFVKYIVSFRPSFSDNMQILRIALRDLFAIESMIACRNTLTTLTVGVTKKN